ncbi:MAG: ATP-dependent DNA helicase [Halothiobacillaceae bacterium]
MTARETAKETAGEQAPFTVDVASSAAARWLGPEGAFGARLEGFAPRAAQQRMAAIIEQAIDQRRTVVLEAGTGVGKTFGYLVPALLSGAKVLVSTGTRHLQDQLFCKDLPRVREVLGRPLDVALLKGRANYVCLHRMTQLNEQGLLRSREQVVALGQVRHWAAGSRSGDIAECTTVPEDHAIWPMVTSTTDNCLGSDCPLYEDCHVVCARRAALDADVVVVNHHLFCADLALREEGFAELLPNMDAVILDEAHQLPEVAASFFSESLSSRQLLDLARDVLREQASEARDMPDLRDRAAALEKATKDVILAFRPQRDREAWAAVAQEAALCESMDALDDALADLQEALDAAAPKGKGFEALLERCQAVRVRLSMLRETDPEEADETEAEGPPEQVRWYEKGDRHFALHLTPLEAGSAFQKALGGDRRAWIFTSATLATGRGDFTHFNRRLGLWPDHAERLDSPFDYARQALLYLPPDLPEPSDPEYTLKALRAVYPAIKAAEGRAFLLFTSHRAMRAAEEILEGKLPFPLFVQGQLPKRELLERFRESGNGVLLGTQSFWEGVDVRGRALSLVMIDKLPFAMPDDPVLRGRAERVEHRGGSSFMEISLPEAQITLKQGVGRLIRDVSDSGVLVLCDPRLSTKRYGQQFLDALPPMPRTRDMAEVRRFLATLDDPPA